MKEYPVLYERMGEKLVPQRKMGLGVFIDPTETVIDVKNQTVRSRWYVGRVELPDWLAFEEWLVGHEKWSTLWTKCPESKSLPEHYQRGLLSLLPKRQRVLALLLILDEPPWFLRRIRERVDAWLNTPEEQRGRLLDSSSWRELYRVFR